MMVLATLLCLLNVPLTLAKDNLGKESLFCNGNPENPSHDETRRCGERPYGGNMAVIGDTGATREDGSPATICAWELKPGECWKGDAVSGTEALDSAYKAPNGTSFTCNLSCVLVDSSTLAGRWEWQFNCHYDGNLTRAKMFASLFYKSSSYGWMSQEDFHDKMGSDRPIRWCNDRGEIMEEYEPIVPGNETSGLDSLSSFGDSNPVAWDAISDSAENVDYEGVWDFRPRQ